MSEVRANKVAEMALTMSDDSLVSLERAHSFYRAQLIDNLLAEQDIILALRLEMRKRGLYGRAEGDPNSGSD